jgi:AAA+ ATPase superfamily predicted ATPase
MFYGRQDDFKYIKTKLEDGNKSYIIVLCGERRSGKTSILFQILSGRLGENFVPILIDMQTMAGLKNDLEFFEKFAQETSKCLNEKIGPADLFKTTTDSSFKAFSGFLDAIHDKYSGKHILFLIDEYEIIESKIEEGSLSKNFIPFLAGTLESEKPVSFIFTGSSQIDQRKGSIWQVLFGKSLFRNVSFLSKMDTERLIKEPVKEIIEYQPETINQIYKLTYGQPFYTQVVCQNIVDYVNQKQRTNIQLEDLDIVINEILENPLPQMIYFWNSLQADKKLILSLLAEVLQNGDQRVTPQEIIKETKKKKFGLNLSVKDVSTTLEALFHTNYVSKSQEGFCFQMDLFRRWVKRDHAIWRVMKEVSTINNPSAASSTGFETTFTTESGIEKSRKLLVPLLSVVIILLVLTWWFFLRSDTHVTESVESTPEETTEERQSTPVQKPKKAETPPQEEVKKDPAPVTTTETETRRTQQAVSRTTVANNEVEKAEQLLEQKALTAQEDMLTAKQTAISAGADKLAGSLFSRAQNLENEGSRNFRSKNYSTAKNNFEEADELFRSATAEGGNALSKLENDAKKAKTVMNQAKQKLNAQHQALSGFQQAQAADEEAEKFLTQGRYEDSIQKFKAATTNYNAAIREYDDIKNDITTIIGGYLNGIQNESIVQMKRYHSNFSSDLQRDWQGLFDYAEDIKVGRTFKNYSISSNKASVEVDVNLDFKGADKSRTLNQWKFNMEKTAASWTISSINDGN